MFVVLLFVCVLINKLHCLKTRCTLEPGIEAYEEADRGIDTRHDADKAMLKAYAWKLLYLYILNIEASPCAQAYVTLGLIPDAIQCSMVGHLEFIHNNNKHLCEYENEMAYNIYIYATIITQTQVFTTFIHDYSFNNTALYHPPFKFLHHRNTAAISVNWLLLARSREIKLENAYENRS